MKDLVFLELEKKEILKKVLNGEIPIYKLDELLGDSNLAASIRRDFLNIKLGIKIENLAKNILNLNEIYGRHTENLIGAIQIPVGIAGPLPINGLYAKGNFYIPLATTEGALVASVNRGCSAIAKSGGASAAILNDEMSRAPALKTPSLYHSIKLIEWIKSNFDEIKRAAESTTSHGKLIRIDPFIIGKIVYLRFTYQTGDAMGMNMATKATHEAIKYIKEKNNFIKEVTLSGNVCTDKKVSSINWVLGRGKTVVAEATILREVVEKTLKTTPEAMVEVNYVKNYLGSARAGTIGGHNAHVANVIAGIFIATGQDPAQIMESASALTSLEMDEEGNLYASLFMPSLEVGVVGGGTRLQTQRECLRIMGCEGKGENSGEIAKRFAEIIASAALAGEISLIAALASDDLVKAHEKFGRNKIY